MTDCEDLFTVQLNELIRVKKLHDNLDDLYQNKIGTLYDEFNIEIPLRFGKEYAWLWKDETKESIKEATEIAAGILNEVRVKPKPYQPLSSEDVKQQVKIIEKAILSDMLDKLVGCVCRD
jgi:hypothetical protein